MKSLGTVIFLAMLGTGCISDNASVAPRSTIRLDRTGSNPAALASAGQPGGTNTLLQANAITNEPAALGAAPHISQTPNAATLAETNSLTGVNAPRLTAPTGTIGTGIGTPPTGTVSTPSLNPAAGGSTGTGLGGTTTGSAIGPSSNTVTGLTNNFLGNTNLFSPRQQ